MTSKKLIGFMAMVFPLVFAEISLAGEVMNLLETNAVHELEHDRPLFYGDGISARDSAFSKLNSKGNFAEAEQAYKKNGVSITASRRIEIVTPSGFSSPILSIPQEITETIDHKYRGYTNLKSPTHVEIGSHNSYERGNNEIHYTLEPEFVRQGGQIIAAHVEPDMATFYVVVHFPSGELRRLEYKKLDYKKDEPKELASDGSGLSYRYMRTAVIPNIPKNEFDPTKWLRYVAEKLGDGVKVLHQSGPAARGIGQGLE